MSTSQCAPESGLADQPVDVAQGVATGASKLLKGLLIGFAATVTIALALASWYVGVRIVAANEAIPASSPAPASEVPAVAPAENFWDTIAPPAPALYLEVAGLGAEKDASFVKKLEKKEERLSSEDRGGGKPRRRPHFDRSLFGAQRIGRSRA